MTRIKWALIATALAWSVVNIAGLLMAMRMGEELHAFAHFVAFVALVGGAYYLKRSIRTRSVSSIKHPAETAMLVDEVHRLQRELDEAKRGRDFAEQLLDEKRDRPDVR